MKLGNKPFTQREIQLLTKGYTPSGEYPNRKNRRRILQKITHRPNMAMVDFIQWIGSKPIYHYKQIINPN